MYVRTKNMKVDRGVSTSRGGSRAAARFHVGWLPWVLATLGVIAFLAVLSLVLLGSARNFAGVMGVLLILLVAFGRRANNRRLHWAQRSRTLSSERAERGRDRVRANRAVPSLDERAKRRLNRRQSVVQGDARTWKRESTSWGRLALLVVLMLVWAYLAVRWIVIATQALGGGLWNPVGMVVFFAAMAGGLKLFSHVLFPTRSRRVDSGDPVEEPDEADCDGVPSSTSRPSVPTRGLFCIR